MKRESLQAIIFDMDGVLCATVDLHHQSWQKALAPYGITWTREQNDALRSLTRSESLQQILHGRSLPEADRKNILQKKNEFYLAAVDTLSPADLLPGVGRLLDEIRVAGLRCGVASASSNTRRVLTALDVHRYFGAVADANDVPVSKPAPDVYLSVAGRLRLEPCQCLALDDSQAGVKAAANAGMCAVGIGKHAVTPEAQAVFPHLEHVRLQDLLRVYQSANRCANEGCQHALGEFPAL